MYADGRHKRAWKACERCRTKKTKRCKDNGLVCVAGVRKQKDYKKLPQGYGEVLEHTQFVLIATIHKLYSMARNNQQWDLGEPELNDRGEPVIHNIAQKLGCIRPKSDVDLPDPALSCECSGRVSSAKVDHSHFEADYRKAAFGQHNMPTNTSQSFSIGRSECDVDFVASPVYPTVKMFQDQSSTMNVYVPQLALARQAAPPQPPAMGLTQHFFQQHNDTFCVMSMLNQGLIENSLGSIEPHILLCPDPDVMGMGDSMMCGDYAGEPMWL